MANVNKVLLIGNLTRDPEFKLTPNGLAVAEFGLAINRSFSSDSGEKREEVTFVDITVWGKTAELVQKYLTKGRQIYIEGRLQLSSWDDKETGQKRSKLRVIGEHIEFLGSKPDGGSPRERTMGGTTLARMSAPRTNGQPSHSRQTAAASSVEEDNIPF